MKAHQFANQLLAGPDLPILAPKVIEWDDSEDCCADPFVTEEEGEDSITGYAQQVLVIAYRDNSVLRPWKRSGASGASSENPAPSPVSSVERDKKEDLGIPGGV